MNRPPRKEIERGLYAPVWRKINQMLDYMQEISVTGGRGVKVDRKSTGTFLTADIPRQEESASGVVKQFRVKSIGNDYLICREFDGNSESGPDVKVAKDFNLRRTVWHGLTVNYAPEPYPGAPAQISISYSFPQSDHTYRIARVTIGAVSTTEHQVVIPRWVPDLSVIFASASENGTGVSNAPDWQDMNVSGRAWANVL